MRFLPFLMWLLCAPVMAAVGNDEFDLNIPAADADIALKHLSRQTGHSVIFQSVEVEDIKTNSLAGRYTIHAAIEVLLQGTILMGGLTESGVITISRKPTGKKEENHQMSIKNPGKSLFAGLVAIITTLTATPHVAGQENAGKSGSLTLEEIIVTAQKREQSLQDVPITISTLDGDTIQQQGVDDLLDIAPLVPGMIFGRAPDDGLILTFRGLGTAARSSAFEMAVSYFIDGVFMGKQRLYTMPFFDVDQIEFVKGTQSTLLGKNTSAGGVTVATRRPGDEFGGKISAGYEVEHGGYRIDGAVDLPVSDDFRMRAAFHTKDMDGTFKNAFTGNDAPQLEETAFRLTGVWDISEDASLTTWYQYTDNDRLGDGNQILADYSAGQTATAILLATGATLDIEADDTTAKFVSGGKDGESFHDTDVHIASAAFKLDNVFGDHEFVSQIAAVYYDTAWVDDFDYNIIDTQTFARNEHYTQITEEVRLASPEGETVDYLVGLFYLYSDWDSDELQGRNVPDFIFPIPGLGNVQFNDGPQHHDFQQEINSIAVFGSATWNITDSLRINGGLRFVSESKDTVFGRRNTRNTLFNTIFRPPFPDTDLEFDDDFLNGGIQLQYDWSDSVMTYASFSVGTRTGGHVETVDLPTGDPADSLLKSETTTNYEAGAKLSLLDGRMDIATAFFFTDVEDFQDNTFTGTAFITENTPVEAIGGEFSAKWQVSEYMRLNFGVTYSDVENKLLREIPAASAKWTGNLQTLYEYPLNVSGSPMVLRVNGLLNFRSSFPTQRAGFPGRIPGYSGPEQLTSSGLTTFDLTLEVAGQDDIWSIAVVGRNISDSRSKDFSFPCEYLSAGNPSLFAGNSIGPYPGGVECGVPTAGRTITLLGSYAF